MKQRIVSFTLKQILRAVDPKHIHHAEYTADLKEPQLFKAYGSTLLFGTRSSKFFKNHIIWRQKVLFKDFIVIARDKEIPIADAVKYAIHDLDVHVNCNCLTGDTVIPLLDGTRPTIEEVVTRFQAGEDLYVYSTDDKGNFVPDRILNAFRTKYTQDLLEVTLDNGETVRCTPEHPFIMRDGSERLASDLKDGDSLMPLYTQFDAKGYEYALRPDGEQGPYRQYIFKGVANKYLPHSINAEDHPSVHHVSHKKTDNRPTNLRWMTRDAHYSLHSVSKFRPHVVAGVKKWNEENQELLSSHRAKAGRACQAAHPGIWRAAVSKAIEFMQSPQGLAQTRAIGQKAWADHRTEFTSRITALMNTPESRTRSSAHMKAVQDKLWADPTHAETVRSRLIAANLDHNGMDSDTNKLLVGVGHVMSLAAGCQTSADYDSACEGRKKKFRWDSLFSSFDRVIFWRDEIFSSKHSGTVRDGLKSVMVAEVLEHKASLWAPRVCPICGVPYSPKDLDQKVCSNTCKAVVVSRSRLGTHNHKVASVRAIHLASEVPVYDLTIEDTHKFLIGPGIVVHNCPASLYYGYRYLATQLGYHYGLPRENRPPVVRNPQEKGTVCFAAGTKVLMANGKYQSIESIKEGDRVISHTGVPRAVTATMARESSVGKLVVRGANTPIYVTPEHPFYSYAFSRQVCACGCGELLGAVRHQTRSSLFSRTFKPNHHRRASSQGVVLQSSVPTWNDISSLSPKDALLRPELHFEATRQVEPRFAFLLGYYLADGHISYNLVQSETTTTRLLADRTIANPNRVSLTAGVKQADSVSAILASRYPRLFTPVPKHNSRGSWVDFESTSGLLLQQLASWGGIGAPSHGTNKVVSSEVFGWSPGLKWEFIKGFFLGDGCFDSRGYIILDNTNEDIARALSVLLWSLGVPHEFSNHAGSPGLLSNWRVKLNTQEAFLHLSKFDEVASVKASAVAKATLGRTTGNFKDGYYLTSVVSYQEVPGVVPVYNIEVEEDNSYLVEGLAVHNCKHSDKVLRWVAAHEDEIIERFSTLYRKVDFAKALDRYEEKNPDAAKGYEEEKKEIDNPEDELAFEDFEGSDTTSYEARGVRKASADPVLSYALDDQAFLAWFGKSEIVDEEGKPLRVYHGTREDFSKFDPNKDTRGNKLLFFSLNPEFSSHYSQGDGGRSIPCYLRVLKLFKGYEHWSLLKGSLESLPTTDDAMEELYSGGLGEEIVARAHEDECSLEDSWLFYLRQEDWQVFEYNPRVIREIRSLGFDGIRLDEDGQPTLAVFSSDQAKSTMSNRGGFRGTAIDESSLVTEAVGKAKISSLIHDYFWSDSVLDELLEATEGDAVMGGCQVVAKAILLAFGSGDLVRLVSDIDGGQTEHFGASVDGIIYDGDGAHKSGKAWAADTARSAGLEDGDRPMKLAEGPDNKSTIYDGLALSKKLAEGLRVLLREAGAYISGPEFPPILSYALDNSAFKAWFKDSKVVNPDGSPKVCYHFSASAGFNEFKIADHDIGIHFGTAKAAMDRSGYNDPTSAHAQYLEEYEGEDEPLTQDEFMAGSPEFFATEHPNWRGGNTHGTYLVYLSIQNPIEVHDQWDWEPSELAKDIVKRRKVSPALLAVLKRDYVPYFGMNSPGYSELRALLLSHGYDGLVYKNGAEDRGSISYCVFSPSQVKSALSNKGDFKGEAIDEASDPGQSRSVSTVAFKFPRELSGYSDIHSIGETSGVLSIFGRGVVDPATGRVVLGLADSSHVTLAKGIQDAKRFYYGYARNLLTVYLVSKNGMDDDFFRDPKVLQSVLSEVFNKFRLSVAAGKRLVFQAESPLPSQIDSETMPTSGVVQQGVSPVTVSKALIHYDQTGDKDFISELSAQIFLHSSWTLLWADPKKCNFNLDDEAAEWYGKIYQKAPAIIINGFVMDGSHRASAALQNGDLFLAYVPDDQLKTYTIDSVTSAPSSPHLETEAFKAWFQGSKITDKAGKPLVMYHGRPRSNTNPDHFPTKSFKGAYFTSDPSYAANYTPEFRAEREETDYDSDDLTGSVFPVYLSVQNPLYIDPQSREGREAYTQYGEELYPEALEAKGYDGVVMNWGNELEVTIFHPEQAKSVFNGGGFDPKNKSLSQSLLLSRTVPEEFSDKRLTQRAIKEFGVTDNAGDAFFVLPNGDMLDGSGGDGYGRTIDHHSVDRLLPGGKSRHQTLMKFMRFTGCVRVDFGINMVDSVGVPNSSQIDTIAFALVDEAKLTVRLLSGEVAREYVMQRPSKAKLRAFYANPRTYGGEQDQDDWMMSEAKGPSSPAINSSYVDVAPTASIYFHGGRVGPGGLPYPNGYGLVFVSPSYEEAALFGKGKGMAVHSFKVTTDNIFDGFNEDHLDRIGEDRGVNEARLYDSSEVEDWFVIEKIQKAGFDGFFTRDYPAYPDKIGQFRNVALFGNAKLQPYAIQSGDREGTSYEADPTSSPAFQAWFKGSKAVDADGKPLVVYHGTGKRFRKFDRKKSTQGIFWATTDNAAVAGGDVGAQGKGIILSMYASIKNPAGWYEYDRYSLDELLRNGYDGAILPEKDGNATVFVFESSQFKSTANKGTWRTDSDFIMESLILQDRFLDAEPFPIQNHGGMFTADIPTDNGIYQIQGGLMPVPMVFPEMAKEIGQEPRAFTEAAVAGLPPDTNVRALTMFSFNINSPDGTVLLGNEERSDPNLRPFTLRIFATAYAFLRSIKAMVPNLLIATYDSRTRSALYSRLVRAATEGYQITKEYDVGQVHFMFVEEGS